VTTAQRVVILASGNGSNAQVLLDHAAQPDVDFEVVAVVSDHADAHVLQRAERASVPAECLEREPGEARPRYDHRLAGVLAPYRPDLVVLAGWMRILTAEFCSQFSIINLHPAKPGEFPGATAITDAFDAFTEGRLHETGVMVHWVPDAGVDSGPVLRTETVPILTGDSLDDLTKRVHAVEHRLLPAALLDALQALENDPNPARPSPQEVSR